MPAQPPFMVAPPYPNAQVPGAINLTEGQLTGDMIVPVATKGSPAAQTTLDNLKTFVSGTYRVATADITVAAEDGWIVNNKAGSSNTVTLLSAASFPNRQITLTNWQAQTVVSGASDVIPLGGGAAGTAILSGATGKWCTLVSDGSDWVIVAGVV